jgi:hypothetical protein
MQIWWAMAEPKEEAEGGRGAGRALWRVSAGTQFRVRVRVRVRGRRRGQKS